MEPFCNVIEGWSNTDSSLDVIHIVVEATCSQSGDNVLNEGDTVVMDNVAFHHNGAERILSPWLWDTVFIHYTFRTQVFHRVFYNPAELTIKKMKPLLKSDHIRQIAYNNLDVAVYEALNLVIQADIVIFYRLIL